MGQVRNVALILVITAFMAALTTVLAYFFDLLPAAVSEALATDLAGGVQATARLK